MIEKVAELALMLTQQGFMVLVSSMAPLRIHRQVAHSVMMDSVTWIHVDATPATCALRDPKHLYRNARDGRIPDFLDFPFDPPATDETVWSVNNDHGLPGEAIDQVWNRFFPDPGC